MDFINPNLSRLSEQNRGLKELMLEVQRLRRVVALIDKNSRAPKSTSRKYKNIWLTIDQTASNTTAPA